MLGSVVFRHLREALLALLEVVCMVHHFTSHHMGQGSGITVVHVAGLIRVPQSFRPPCPTHQAVDGERLVHRQCRREHAEILLQVSDRQRHHHVVCSELLAGGGGDNHAITGLGPVNLRNDGVQPAVQMWCRVVSHKLIMDGTFVALGSTIAVSFQDTVEHSERTVCIKLNKTAFLLL